MRDTLTYDYVKKQIEKTGYKLLSKKYVNNCTKLKIQCNKGHIYKVTWASFKQGTKCPECFGSKKYTYKYIKEQIEKEGYKLLSTEYINARSKMEVQCNKRHNYELTWNSFQQGQRCLKCYNEKNIGKNHHLWKGGVTELSIPLYDKYAHQIDWCEDTRRDPENKDYLQVRCTNSGCKKWFMPITESVWARVSRLNSIIGEGRFYCSENCKHSCSLYRQRLYFKGNKPHQESRDPDWSKMVKERDNYECQICGSTEDLIAHHFEGLEQNPIESADIDMGITLCKICERRAHKDKGCRYVDLTKKQLCKGG